MIRTTVRWVAPLALIAAAIGFITVLPNTQAARKLPKVPFERYAEDAREAAAIADRMILDAPSAQGLTPAPLTADEAFLRRATLDLVARIPTTSEYHAYFEDDPDTRRANLVDRLLNDPRFNDRWAMFFGDMMNIRSSADGGGQFHKFIHRSLHQRKPYDRMVYELVTATGSLRDNAPVGFFTGTNAEPLQVTGILTQTLMGIRMQCAQCHDHPYDVWTQKDYYGVAAYFGYTDVRENEKLGLYVIDTGNTTILWPPKPRKNRPQKPVQPTWPIDRATGEEKGLAQAIDKLEQQQEIRNDLAAIDDLLSGAAGAQAADDPTAGMLDHASEDLSEIAHGDRPQSKRVAFAEHVTDPTNRFFGWNLSNRIFAELMGRGIVNPIDDIKADNPPSNADLLNHLSDHLIASEYDIRALIAAIVMSEAYQRDRLPGLSPDERKPIEQAFLAAPLRRMNAESLYDSIRLAGHVGNIKHSPGKNARDIKITIRVPVQPDPMMASEAGPEQSQGPDTTMMAAMGDIQIDDPFASESSVDVKELLATAITGDDPLQGNRILTVDPDDVDPEKIAMREAQARADLNNPRKFETKTITRTIDDNPRFQSAMKIRAPAPPEHFLRQFGQTSRVILGEKRDAGANTRQALLLLNGKLANQAARVGDLEPVFKLMHPDIPADKAIKLVYLECLTREPTAEELKAANEVFQGYDDRADAVADLRWAIFNSHEFRHLP